MIVSLDSTFDRIDITLDAEEIAFLLAELRRCGRTEESIEFGFELRKDLVHAQRTMQERGRKKTA